MRVALIIPAAGSSSRYEAAGGLRSKLDEDLGGRPVIQRTIELFEKHELVGPMIGAIIVAGPHGDEAFKEFKDQYADRFGLIGAKLVRGGKDHRWQTVKAALEHVPADCTHIAVHDAARPCTPPEVLDRVFDLAQHCDAVIPAVEVADTLKRVKETDETVGGDDHIAAILGEAASGKQNLLVVESTIDRGGLYAVQTPQVFEAALLKRAYAQSDLGSTDDAGLVERLGERVAVAAGDVRNIKITRPADLALARAIMGVRGPEGKPAHKRF